MYVSCAASFVSIEYGHVRDAASKGLELMWYSAAGLVQLLHEVML